MSYFCAHLRRGVKGADCKPCISESFNLIAFLINAIFNADLLAPSSFPDYSSKQVYLYAWDWREKWRQAWMFLTWSYLKRNIVSILRSLKTVMTYCFAPKSIMCMYLLWNSRWTRYTMPLVGRQKGCGGFPPQISPRIATSRYRRPLTWSRLKSTKYSHFWKTLRYVVGWTEVIRVQALIRLTNWTFEIN